MARKPVKTLEEQLAYAKDNLLKAENRVEECKRSIVDIEAQIEDRDMREAYRMLKEKGVSVSQLQKILAK